MISALISGTNIKVDGTPRQWNCVEYLGHHNFRTVQVIERGQIRQINLDTFTGTVLTSDFILQYENGKPVSKDWYFLPF